MATFMLEKRLSSSKGQRGFALIITLVFVGFFAAILTSIVSFNRDQARENQATVAGAEAVQIAKAARMYVRDQLAANEAGTRTDAIAGRVINIDTDLQDRGYLPASFGKRIGANDFRNSLGQRIFAVMAMYPPGSAAATAVPTAYIYLDPSTSTAGDMLPRYMLLAAESARRLGTAVSAPTFDLAGTNTSPDCTDDAGNTTRAAAIWDTGCLTNNEFRSLSASLTGAPFDFPAGGFIIPTWRSEKFDLRAVMRFPQPENPGGSTMLTDLDMGVRNGTLSGGRVLCTDTIQTTRDKDDGTYEDNDTGLCKVVSDTIVGGAVTAQRRFDIGNIGDLASDYLIADPTQQNDGNVTGEAEIILRSITSAAPVGTAKGSAALRIGGDAVINNDVAVYDKMPMNAANGITGATPSLRQRLSFSNTTGNALVVGRNISVQADGANLGYADVVPEVSGGTAPGNLTTRTLRADRIVGKTLDSSYNNATDADFGDDDRIVVDGNVTSQRLSMGDRRSGGGAVLTQSSIVSKKVTISDKSTVKNNLETLGEVRAPNSSTVITGASSATDPSTGTAYSYATGILNVSGDTTISELSPSASNNATSISASGTNSRVGRLFVGEGGTPKAVCEDNPAYNAFTGFEGCPNIQDAPTVIDP